MHKIDKYLDTIMNTAKLASRDARRVRSELKGHLLQSFQAARLKCLTEDEQKQPQGEQVAGLDNILVLKDIVGGGQKDQEKTQKKNDGLRLPVQ